ncbi:MAG: Crp/Fnr family transcriptional regulator [Campylobacteraceae bacterium]|nr:Crp/Fnr family transcriptional regulator [Campylobacteraceae bacterium]
MESVFKNSSLFFGLDDDKIERILNCITYKVMSYDKDVYLYELSQGFKTIIVAKGVVDMISLDDDGKEIIDNRFVKNSSVVYDFIKDERILKTKTDSTLIYMNTQVIFSESKKNCKYRALFMENIIKSLNSSLNHLTFKLNLYSKTHLRDRIILFLKNEMLNSNFIELKFNREDLAKYLACNRSALSRELSLMEKDGLIEIRNRKIFIKT